MGHNSIVMAELYQRAERQDSTRLCWRRFLLICFEIFVGIVMRSHSAIVVMRWCSYPSLFIGYAGRASF